nr:NYN domain-containing protein [uncultured Sphingosinicella sp.]
MEIDVDADRTPSTAPSRRIALLIDADNVSHGKIAAMLAELSKYGVANIRRAYGDWASPSMKGWTARLHEHAIRPIQQFSYSKGKNATDMALVIDAMELLYTQKPDAFCIASSDADFTPLVMQLRANGHEVYGFGERKTPEPFVNACSTFLYLDRLGEEGPSAPAAAAPAAPAKAEAKPAAGRAPKADGAKPPLAQDAKLVAVLRGAVEATAGDDGWANLSAAGSAAKRQAPIDPRNYGARNFPKLFEATGLFEIVKAEDGHTYVADKRNRDRAPAPGGARGETLSERLPAAIGAQSRQ